MTVPAVSENGAYDLTSIGLKLRDPDFPFEDFEQLCWMLGRFHEAVRFAIGDALNAGPVLYGDDCYQAFEALQLSEDARLEYARVAAALPYSMRRKGLSWSHHRAVASLKKTVGGEVVYDRKAQREWLKRAADENLSHHALREELRESGAAPPAARPALCRCCGRAL